MPGKQTALETFHNVLLKTFHKHIFDGYTKRSKNCKHNWEPIVIPSRFIVMVLSPYWYDLFKGPWK